MGVERQLGNIIRAIEELKKEVGALDKEDVSIDNFDVVKGHLRTELGMLAKTVNQHIKGIKIPQSLSVANFDIKVEDLTTLIEAINDLRAIVSQVDFNPTIEVKASSVNVDAPTIPEIKIPEIKLPKIIVPETKVTVNPEVDLSELLEALEPLQYISDSPKKPLAVRLSDGAKWITALKQAKEQMVTAFTAGGGMTSDEYKTAFKKVSPNIAGTVKSIRKAVASAGTPERVTATSTPIKYCLVSVDNEDDEMVIGDANIDIATTACRGCVIYPGSQPVRIDIDNLNKLYVDALNTGDAISITYFS